MTESNPATSAAAEDQSQQYLTFMMADEEYGVDILSVQEIRGWEATTVIPNAPPHVKGVINLRGTIVPIIDLRQRFGIKTLAYGPTTVVIVLKVRLDKQHKVMGIVVDAVSDVFSITQSEIRSAPDFGQDTDMRFIHGLTCVADKMVILLNINMLLGNEVLPDASQLSSLLQQLDLEQPQAANL
ncbi:MULTISPECIES: chemotaxis protein CheW [Shewanella]|jgi:purine-binding chemotaxis protein CheW|uniref:Chemotaxis protein CheW n=3 Tax=Bacteria TaxID=2 RepID=A0A379ZMB3_9GAMM|nr:MULTISPECIES: chemotaxis protein CheW [Shewanella]AXQ14072.1 chemotaxis protein CheW [Shewanella algae]AYV11846.1 purine-binding chemotaxis protein CheW [Shewanella algae]EKT4489243.1 purine-binding chemotaxis protein CheW [Shewanella algae]MBC8796067.1 purine-binding chemotaxis protein CheW [Shewanella algae]MBO2550429.1 purine-binding chemotaxis protein CheW [Shewanella algae]